MEINDIVNNTSNNTNNVIEQKVIDIYAQQRNGRKCWTIVKNFCEVDKKDFVKILRKKFSCSGSIDDDGYIWLTGDHRSELQNIIIDRYKYEKSCVKIH